MAKKMDFSSSQTAIGKKKGKDFSSMFYFGDDDAETEAASVWSLPPKANQASFISSLEVGTNDLPEKMDREIMDPYSLAIGNTDGSEVGGNDNSSEFSKGELDSEGEGSKGGEANSEDKQVIDGGKTVDVEWFDHGAVLAALYATAAVGNPGQKKRRRGKAPAVGMAIFIWLPLCLFALYGAIGRMFLLWLLHLIVTDNTDRAGSDEGKPYPVFVFAVTIIHVMDLSRWLIGRFNRCFYCVRHLPDRTPSYRKFVARFLVAAELGAGATVFWFGLKYLARSETKTDLLLDAVALHYILDLDDLLVAFLPNMLEAEGEAGTLISVPKDVIRPVWDKRGFWFRTVMFLFLIFPIVPSAIGILTAWVVDVIPVVSF